MPNIQRFLIKTLCVFGVTFTLTLPHNNAWGASWCDCNAQKSCNFFNSGDGHNYSTCSGTYCQAEDQLWCDDFLRSKGLDPSEYTCKFTCPNNNFDAYCDSCKDPWSISYYKNTVEENNCHWGYKCGTLPYALPNVRPQPTGYYVTTHCIPLTEPEPKSKQAMLSYSCDISKKYYQTSSTIICNTITDRPNTECGNQVDQLILSNCTGCSTTPCNDKTPEWKNCGNTGMNCFANDGSVTLCAPGEADGTNGCYDPNLYERQVEQTFNASANNGNGSCTEAIRNNDWRCKKGYYPTDIKPYAESDLQREPNFRCTPCPVGYISAEYNDKTQTWLHDTSFDNDLGASRGDVHSCKKCPAAFTTDTPDPSKGLIIDSVQMCYIDPNVMLSDSLGKITLSEEIGSGTKLYYQ